MDKTELLFYSAYEELYTMAKTSHAFQSFCKDAFGEDFSQDGFSDLSQINRILEYIPKKENVHILDIGCGNGKMLRYLQEKTSSHIHGFDYSEHAIETAKSLHRTDAEFRQGVIGEIDYPADSFDVIISMDTIYFAPDITAFVSQIKSWLKPDGIFFVGYQEGDVIPKTQSMGSSLLSQALHVNQMPFEVVDITKETYHLLQKKRAAALAHEAEFIAEGNGAWFDMLIGQTDCILENLEEFSEKMSRYLFTAGKR